MKWLRDLSITDWVLFFSVIITIFVFLYANEVTGAETCSCECPCVVEEEENYCPDTKDEWADYREAKQSLTDLLRTIPKNPDDVPGGYEKVLDVCSVLIDDVVRCEKTPKLLYAYSILTAQCYSRLPLHPGVAAAFLYPYRDRSEEIMRWWANDALAEALSIYQMCVVEKDPDWCFDSIKQDFNETLTKLQPYAKRMGSKFEAQVNKLKRARW